MNVNIQNYSRWHVNTKLQEVGQNEKWKFTGFYGHSEVCKRKELRDLSPHLGSFNPKAWLCIGDFNKIMMESKKNRGCSKASMPKEGF